MYSKLLYSLLYLLLSHSLAKSQFHEILDDFYVIQINNEVKLRWVIKNGQTCNGIQIYRSQDTLNFERIGEIPGICGSTNEAVPYDFVDSFPIKNKTNFYRLQLGNQGYSQYIQIDYKFYGLNDWNILNTNSKIEVIFRNTTKTEIKVQLLDINGKLIQSKATNSDSVEFEKHHLSRGIYLIQAFENDKVYFVEKIML